MMAKLNNRKDPGMSATKGREPQTPARKDPMANISGILNNTRGK